MTADILQQSLTDLYQRVVANELVEADFLDASQLVGQVRSAPTWIEFAVRDGLAMQPDAAVFSRFQAEQGWILDIGAHWGYSATAIRASGTNCRVLSFEALEFHSDCLEAVKMQDPLFDYRIVALTSAPGTLELLTPTVNGTPLFGVSSHAGKTLTLAHAGIGVPYLGRLFAESESYEVRLLRSKVPAAQLDSLWSCEELNLDVLPAVAAIKLDVEGHESDVLSGGLTLIERDKPLLLIEGANRNADVSALMVKLGYRPAEVLGDQIQPTTVEIQAINGCWYHPDRLSAYESMGLIGAAVTAA